jgi:Mrp family chromosome partitioning ATPase
VTGEDKNNPEEPRLMGEGLAGAEVVVSETGGQGASTIFWVLAWEAAAAEQVGLATAATAIEGSVCE